LYDWHGAKHNYVRW
jgi:hypothetical protein